MSSPTSFLRLFDRAIDIVISFFSTFVLSIIILNTEITFTVVIIMIESFILWIIVDNITRKWIVNRLEAKENRQWHAILLRVLDFTSIMGIFLVFQILLELLRRTWETSGMNIGESIVAIYVIMLGSFAIYNTFSYLLINNKHG